MVGVHSLGYTTLTPVFMQNRGIGAHRDGAPQSPPPSEAGHDLLGREGLNPPYAS